MSRYSRFFLKIRSIIILIYNYKCVFCKKETLDLEIHHLDNNRNNDDPFNLKPLCKDCHSLIHKGIKIKWPKLTDIQETMLVGLQYLRSKHYI